jgi:hypothetical protein
MSQKTIWGIHAGKTGNADSLFMKSYAWLVREGRKGTGYFTLRWPASSVAYTTHATRRGGRTPTMR